MKITHVVAMDLNGGIGKDGGLPWKLKGELAHFRRVTSGQVMVMGRKTAESLPKSFDEGDRHLFILTKHKEWPVIYTCHHSEIRSTQEVLSKPNIYRKLMICGGAQTYSAFPPDEIIVTIVDGEYDCDTHYPFANLVTNLLDGKSNPIARGEGWEAYRLTIPF